MVQLVQTGTFFDLSKLVCKKNQVWDNYKPIQIFLKPNFRFTAIFETKKHSKTKKGPQIIEGNISMLDSKLRKLRSFVFFIKLFDNVIQSILQEKYKWMINYSSSISNRKSQVLESSRESGVERVIFSFIQHWTYFEIRGPCEVQNRDARPRLATFHTADSNACDWRWQEKTYLCTHVFFNNIRNSFCILVDFIFSSSLTHYSEQ